MDLYRRTVTRFPLRSVIYMFAYGSGVKKQIGYEKVGEQKNIIDLIFCVKDTLGFHAENIQRHPSHYSALHRLGPNFLRNYQERLGAGVYFNTLVPLEDVGITIKYGVISEESLLQDLIEWRHLYLAGRLHKPVTNLINPDEHTKLKSALDQNLRSAFQTALLLLPARFTAFQLFHTIANLSYKGDFRMIFGENKNKVRNIVMPQQHDFFDLYQPVMSNLTNYISINVHGIDPISRTPTTIFEQDKSVKALIYHLSQLPKELKRRLSHNAAFHGKYMDIIENLAQTSSLSEVVQASVNDIVWRGSITQSLKNIASAGLLKSLVYSYRKAAKTFAL